MEKEQINDYRVIDYRVTEIGRQNWEVCARMLAHDLVDMAERIPEIKDLCRFYSITVLPNGAHTMALPRKEVLRRKTEAEDAIRAKPFVKNLKQYRKKK